MSTGLDLRVIPLVLSLGLDTFALSTTLGIKTNDILKKLPLVGKDLKSYSLETVEMFYKDAKAAGFTIAAREAA